MSINLNPLDDHFNVRILYVPFKNCVSSTVTHHGKLVSEFSGYIQKYEISALLVAIKYSSTPSLTNACGNIVIPILDV